MLAGTPKTAKRRPAIVRRMLLGCWLRLSTLAGIAGVLEYVNQFELSGDVWPVEEAYGIGPDSWHYKLRQTMAAAAVNLA